MHLQSKPIYYSTYIPQLIQLKTILGDTVALVYNNPHHFAIAGLVLNLCGQFSKWWLAVGEGVECTYTPPPQKKKKKSHQGPYCSKAFMVKVSILARHNIKLNPQVTYSVAVTIFCTCTSRSSPNHFTDKSQTLFISKWVKVWDSLDKWGHSLTVSSHVLFLYFLPLLHLIVHFDFCEY